MRNSSDYREVAKTARMRHYAGGFRRLELPEIMDLHLADIDFKKEVSLRTIVGEFIVTLKLLGMGFKVMTDYAATEFKDESLGEDILSLCERNLAHPQKLLPDYCPQNQRSKFGKTRTLRTAAKNHRRSSA